MDDEREQGLFTSGADVVCGLDEVGRGALAGTLVVGAVAITADCGQWPAGLRDSKRLSEKTRVRVADEVPEWCVASGLGVVYADECDKLGMSAALKLAGQRALAVVEQSISVDAILLDGPHNYLKDNRVRCVVRGDDACASIAAASNLAKVYRDADMRLLATDYPYWGFERNVGYASAAHQIALIGYGPSAIHRMSWASIRKLPWASLYQPAASMPTLFDA